MRLLARWSRSKRIFLQHPLHPCSSQNSSRKLLQLLSSRYNPLLSWSTWRTHVKFVTPAPTVAQTAPVTTSTVAPTVFPTTVPIGANRHWDSVEDIPVAQQSLLPTVQTVQKTGEIPQVRHIDKVVGVPVVGQRQAPIIQTEQKTIDVHQIQCLEPLVDVPVVTQKMRTFRKCSTMTKW